MMARSYLPTERLIALRQRDPEIAGVIEDLCNAIRATLGPLMYAGAANVIKTCNERIEPWISVPSADVPTMESIAEMFNLAVLSGRKAECSKPVVAFKHIVQRMPGRPGSSGYRGVTFSKQRKKWVARLLVGGKGRHLGVFNTAEEASRAYEAARTQLLAAE
jgi:hypothetical protein